MVVVFIQVNLLLVLVMSFQLNAIMGVIFVHLNLLVLVKLAQVNPFAETMLVNVNTLV